MKIQIQRQNLVKESRFGLLKVNSNFWGFTLENENKLIPVGIYNAKIYVSPKRNQNVILLENVPGRSFIEMHIANWASQLEGCIAPGSYTEGDMLCDSGTVFKRIMNLAVINGLIGVEIS